MMIAPRNCAQLKHEQIDVQVFTEFTRLDGHSRRPLEHPSLFLQDGHQVVSGGAGLVVELGSHRVEDTAAGKAVFLILQRSLHDGPKPGLASRLFEGRPGDDIDVALTRFFEHLKLQLLLRLEVREEPTLAHTGGVGERANGELVEPDGAHQVERLIDDGLSGLFTFTHGR
jgi:hypothetical protein